MRQVGQEYRSSPEQVFARKILTNEKRRHRTKSASILTTAMKCVSVAVLGPALLGFPTETFQVVLKVVVCLAALLAVSQALRADRFVCMTGYSLIAVLFNPLVPLALSRSVSLWVNGICLMAFLMSSGTSQGKPRMSALASKSDGANSVR